MFDWLLWFTDLGNSKIASLLIFFTLFCGILIYVFTGKKRGKRLESYKHIPFQDEEPPVESENHPPKVTEHDRKDQ